MAKKLRYFEKMGRNAKEELIKAVSDLCYDAMMFGYNKAHRVPKSKGARTIRYVTDTPRESVPAGKEYLRANRWTSQSGREYVNDWLRKQHIGAGKNEVRGIVVAAMPYALWLEKGTYVLGLQAQGRFPEDMTASPSAFRIPVISAARTYIKQNYDRYTAEIYRRWGIPKYAINVRKGPEATYLQNNY